MKLIKLAAAAAILVSSLGLPAVPAAAQHRDRGDRWEHDNGRHRGWRNHHRRHRVCRWVWRHHHRTRICTWRYRR